MNPKESVSGASGEAMLRPVDDDRARKELIYVRQSVDELIEDSNGTPSRYVSEDWLYRLSSAIHDYLAAAMNDTARLRYILSLDTFDGIGEVEKDRYEFAMDAAAERGHEEPTNDDELDGFRRLLDAGIAASGLSPGAPEPDETTKG